MLRPQKHRMLVCIVVDAVGVGPALQAVVEPDLFHGGGQVETTAHSGMAQKLMFRFSVFIYVW